MPRFRLRFLALTLFAGAVSSLVGCGITRSTDTARTATEQLLVTDAIDRAVESMNLQPLAGQSIFLDDSRVTDAVDRNYYISTLRQHFLANGCTLKDKREDADFVVEARAGAIGTDRNDLLFGIPTSPVPAIPVISPMPSTLPEIPIAKRKDQRGVAKLALFAYHRATGKPVWQSGVVRQESSANDVWLFGAGPFQHGTIYEDTPLASAPTANGKAERLQRSQDQAAYMKITRELTFNSPAALIQKEPAPNTADKAIAAAPQPPAVNAKPAVAGPASPPVAQTASVPAPANTTAAKGIPKESTSAPSGGERKQTAGTPTTPAKKAPSLPTASSRTAINSAYAGLGISDSPQKSTFNSPQ